MVPKDNALGQWVEEDDRNATQIPEKLGLTCFLCVHSASTLPLDLLRDLVQGTF
jgi:hypothetical protein